MQERTPPESQAYIRALEARIVVLEAIVCQLQEQLQPLSRRKGLSNNRLQGTAYGRR